MIASAELSMKVSASVVAAAAVVVGIESPSRTTEVVNTKIDCSHTKKMRMRMRMNNSKIEMERCNKRMLVVVGVEVFDNYFALVVHIEVVFGSSLVVVDNSTALNIVVVVVTDTKAVMIVVSSSTEKSTVVVADTLPGSSSVVVVGSSKVERWMRLVVVERKMTNTTKPDSHTMRMLMKKGMFGYSPRQEETLRPRPRKRVLVLL